MGARLTDSAEYAHLWGTDEVRAIFDQDARRQTWIDILVALADAQAELGIIPRSSATTIADQARADRLDLDLLAAETRRTSHSTLGFIAALKAILPAEAAEHVYYGVTVQDVTDTWTVLASRRVMAVVWRDLRVLAGLLVELARTHRDHGDGRADARPARRSRDVRLEGRIVGGRDRPAPRTCRRGPSPLAGRPARWGRGHVGFLRRPGPEPAGGVLRPPRPRRPRHQLADQSRPSGRAVAAPGHGDRHAGPHRQRGDGAPADRARRAARGSGRVGRRQHHHAPQAQPGAQRAPGHAGPPHPRPRRGHARGDGAAPRARRPGLEGGMADLPGALPAGLDRAGARPSIWSGPSRSTPTACGRTCSATICSSPSRCWARTPPGWGSTARRTSCRPLLAAARADGRSLAEAVVAAGIIDAADAAMPPTWRAWTAPSADPDGRARRRRRHRSHHAPARRHREELAMTGAVTGGGPAPELIDGAYAYELRTAAVLHDGLNLADMAHLLQLGADGIVPRAGGRGAGRRTPAGRCARRWSDFGYDAASGEPYNSRERRFEHEIGHGAGWLHAGRPRREATRVAFRLHLRREVCVLVLAAARLAAAALAQRGREHRATLFADHTYLQPAQPSTSVTTSRRSRTRCSATASGCWEWSGGSTAARAGPARSTAAAWSRTAKGPPPRSDSITSSSTRGTPCGRSTV